jgi:hypothetical protein
MCLASSRTEAALLLQPLLSLLILCHAFAALTYLPMCPAVPSGVQPLSAGAAQIRDAFSAQEVVTGVSGSRLARDSN